MVQPGAAALNTRGHLSGRVRGADCGPNELTECQRKRDQTIAKNPDADTPKIPGIFTYPGIGTYFVPHTGGGPAVRAPLTLSIFLSPNTDCPAVLSETATFRRLIPEFLKHGQAVVAVVAKVDSSAIAEFLSREELHIPVVAIDFGSYTFEQMGISHYVMPFKILYDSTLTAIYMRGGDNTPESQQSFEKAALRLSQLVAEKNL